MGNVSVFTMENYSYTPPSFTTQLSLNANLRTNPNWQVYHLEKNLNPSPPIKHGTESTVLPFAYILNQKTMTMDNSAGRKQLKNTGGSGPIVRQGLDLIHEIHAIKPKVYLDIILT